MIRLDLPAAASPAASSQEFPEATESPIISGYRAAFECATGMSFEVIPPEDERSAQTSTSSRPCFLGTSTRAGRALCQKTHQRGRCLNGTKCRPVQVECFTGLTHVAWPLEINGRFTGTLWSTGTFCQPPTPADFARAMAPIRRELDPAQERAARRDYFARPVITNERRVLATKLLGELARLLAGEGCCPLNIGDSAEPAAVSKARRFIDAHSNVPIGPKDVVRHLALNQSCFCRLFKRTTRLALREYIFRIRLENVRKRLADSSHPITKVAAAAGFNSIPHFNRMFKRHLGLSPTQYRRTCGLSDAPIVIGPAG